MIVRTYRLEDTESLVELFRQTVRIVNSRDYSTEQVITWAPDFIDTARWKERLARQFVRLVVDEKKILGFASLRGDGYLDLFYVHADHQRRGVGRLLFQAIVEQAHLTNQEEIWTESSITAKPFFEKNGFSVVEEQVVHVRGVSFTNYRMLKLLP